MGILNRLFGFRWSLYIVRNGNELVYVMHENSVSELLDYVIVSGFGEGLSPVAPWGLIINFNKNNKNIKLSPEHFHKNNPSPSLIQRIELIDPKWVVKPGNAVFMEASTKKVLNIRNNDPNEDTSAYLERQMDMLTNNIEAPPDFYSVIHKVFGR